MKNYKELEKNWISKDRTYLLSGRRAPLSWRVPVRHSTKRPLLFFDEEKSVNKEIRYATNQNSVFVEDQEGVSTLGHVSFIDGALYVSRTNPQLQKLMSIYHPLSGKLWNEHDLEQEAVDDLAVIEVEMKAITMVSELDIEHLESILRTEIGSGVADLSSKEIKRDCYMFARSNPKLFIEVAEDEDIKLRNLANRSVEAGILKLTDDGTVFKYAANGKKVMTVPFDQNPYAALSQYFKTDEGVGIMKSLINKLN